MTKVEHHVSYTVTTNESRVFIVSVLVKHVHDVNRAISCGFGDAVLRAHRLMGSPIGRPYNDDSEHVVSVEFREIQTL